MQWDISEKTQTVYYLWRDGAMVINGKGAPYEFESREQAQYAAEHWDEVRGPTYHELRALSDPDLINRADNARRHHLV